MHKLIANGMYVLTKTTVYPITYDANEMFGF